MNKQCARFKNPWNQVRALLWTIEIEVTGTIRYRFSFISDVLTYTILLSLFMFSNSGQSLATKYDTSNYKDLLLAGYIAWTFANAALTSSVNNTSGELVRGTFYRKMNARCPLPLLQAGELFGTIIMNTAVALILTFVGSLAWGLTLRVSFASIAAIVVCSFGMYGMGLVLNGMAITFKRIGSLLFLFQLGLLFVTDTLPSSAGVLAITQAIPLTICNDFIRLSCTGNAPIELLAALSALSALWLIAGATFFNFMLRKAKQHGDLLFY